MTTLAERARTAHRRNIAEAAKETVTLRRGSTDVTITEAVMYEAEYQIMGDDGIVTQVNSMEFLLPQDQVLIDSEEVEPHLNDQLIAPDGKVYEPMKPSQTMPAIVEHCRGEFWLVHAKKWSDS